MNGNEYCRTGNDVYDDDDIYIYSSWSCFSLLVSWPSRGNETLLLLVNSFLLWMAPRSCCSFSLECFYYCSYNCDKYKYKELMMGVVCCLSPSSQVMTFRDVERRDTSAER